MLVDWMMAVLRFAAVASVCPRIVTRDEWGARLPKSVQEMHNPVNFVVVHHTYEPGYCGTPAECEGAMRAMQKSHQDDNGWVDIGYSFAVGGDGRVYKGRGWNRVGAHAPPYNFDSVGIVLIGDWRTETPPQAMLDAAQWLIRCGVETGRISPSYQLLGHRQARQTECPGDALFAEIQGWEHWEAKPAKPSGAPLLDAAAAAVSSSSSTAAPAAAPTPTVEGSYNPATPDAERDAVEVRQLSKRSLWDRLVRIWQQEATRLAQLEQLEQQQAAS